MNFLTGYRSYIAAAIIGIATGLKYAGVIDEATYQMIVGLAGAGGLAALRAAVR